MGKKTKPAKTKTTTGNAFDPFHLDNGVGFTDTSDSREEKNTGENSPFNPFAEDNELAPSSATTVPFPRHLQEEQRHNEILGMQYSATSSFKNDKTGEARERAKFTSSYDTLEAFEHAFGGGAPTEMFSSKKGPSSSSNERQPTVHVAIHEQLAIAHDSVSSIPAIIVTGTIHVTPTKTRAGSFFFLVVKDTEGHMQHSEELAGVCDNITSNLSHIKLDNGDQVFRISLRNPDRLEAPILSYSCVPRLRPMPLMLITKVRATPVNCRVGIRICSNPGNPTALTKAAVLMVVPPDVMGENVSMSRDGGVWDEMKRTLSWTIDEVQPGEMVEIEAQFERLMASHNVLSTPKFPVLMRCEGGAVFSGIYVSTDYSDSRSTKVNMRMIEMSRIMYRKV